tara:strand:+ start:280 stop:486 length:207 start_codon:yes stop_codon:yes gene_type:complete
MPGTTKDFQALPGDLFIYKFSLSGFDLTSSPLFSPWVLDGTIFQDSLGAMREPMRGKVKEEVDGCSRP